MTSGDDTARPPATEPAAAPAAGRRRVLLGHLVANGDCLYATAVARQIKADLPGCHLTWAISPKCARLLDLNPHVDRVWPVPPLPGESGEQTWVRFEADARRRQAAGEFDDAYFTQVAPSHYDRWRTTIRAATYAGYPRPITAGTAPVLRLSAAEVAAVDAFAAEHKLADRPHVVLFECAPGSGQSFVNPGYALAAARALVAGLPGAAVLLSSNVRVDSGDERIVDASRLTLRQNAELTKHCHLLVGCSSGITWIATSDWAKPLPTVQLLAADAVWANAPTRDYAERGEPADHIVEMTACPPEQAAACARTALVDGVAAARARYHTVIPRTPKAYRVVLSALLADGGWGRAARWFGHHLRHHWASVPFYAWTGALAARAAARAAARTAAGRPREGP